jgi:vancomycin permeability regulator SanA
MDAVPRRDVAMVLGAGVLPSGEPTPYLKSRIATAVDLYKTNKVKHLLVSGDNSTSHYNEPVVMKKYAVKLGVKAKDITVDYAGFNTYDSCYRALAIFGVTRMIVVTHGYHLPRAVATCNGLGIQTVGVAAKHTGRDFTLNYIAREMLSTNKALMQIVFKPQPTVLGGPDYIVIR